MKLNEVLKPCPFCGETPTTKVNLSRCGAGELELKYSVVCPKCKTVKTIIIESEGKSFKDHITNMNTTINLWNQRAEV